MSGRRDIFAEHRHEKDFLPRFRQIAADVEAGKVTEKQAAEYLGKSVKTFQRAVAKLKKQEASTATYAPVTGWKELPGIEEWEKWARNRHPQFISSAQEIWEKVWGKKVLQLLTETDMVEAVNWIKRQTQGRQLSLVLAVRALIRGGMFGKTEWLTKHLETGAFKFKRDFPPEFTNEEQFRQVIPRLRHATDKMLNDGTISREEYDSYWMAVDTKRGLGPRTGEEKTEKEVWGCKINAGRTNLALDAEGRIISWTFWAKGNLKWGPISGTMIHPVLKKEVEDYIRKYGLVAGDFLMKKLTSPRAQEIQSMACKIAGITRLRLHDWRKAFFTAGILAGVPMEEMCDLGVGLKDMDTMKGFYVTIKGVKAAESYKKLGEVAGLGSEDSIAYAPGQIPVEK